MIETKRFDDSLTGRIVFPAGWKQAQKKEERKLHAVYRVLRAIHTDVIPTRTLSLPPSPGRRSREIPDENRQRDPRGYRPLFHICMHVVIPPLENSSRFGNRFEFERCTNVSRINSFHLSKTTSFRTRRYLFRALERYWMMMNEMLYIYFFIRSKAWTYRSYVIVNYHANIRLSLTTVVRLATLCIQKKKKRKENTQKRKKRKAQILRAYTRAKCLWNPSSTTR